MMYGIILESARDGVILFYGVSLWRRIVNELKLPSDTFELFARYDDNIIFSICECIADILEEGTRETFLEFFGQDFVRYFANFGFDKIFRVAGRTLRDFLYAIDQLHDSNRFTFPLMQNPLFHVTEENETGATLDYKSVRHGFCRYAIGGLTAAAKALFNEGNLKIDVHHDFSTKDYTHIVFWIQFDNKTYQAKRLSNFPSLPVVNSATFFRIFPFSIIMDSSLCIRHMGNNIMQVFPSDTHLIGRSLDEVFRLIRPDIHVEWDKILSYGRHIVFLIENRLPLRVGPSGKIQLKGQMKYIQNRNILWFLCHPVLGNDNDMISAGLYMNDLNLFDGTSELLVTSIHQTREIEDAIVKQQLWIIKSQQMKNKLTQWRRTSQRLLYSTMPKHIALMLQSGAQPNNICESHPLITVMFAYVMDFKELSVQFEPAQLIASLNEAVNVFDEITNRFDVFKVETKADGSYMAAAGLFDRSQLIQQQQQHEPKLLDATVDDNDEEEEINKNPLGFNQAEIIASLSLALVRASEHTINPITNKPFNVKCGFHSGMAVGGIVGNRNFQYCLFGDTVNMASRIATASEIGKVHVSQTAYNLLKARDRFTLEYRGQTTMKGKGTSETYWLTDMAQEFSVSVINKSPSTLKCPFSGTRV